MGNLIVLILAGNLKLLYFIYKTLHSLGKRFCEYYGKKKLHHMAGSSLLALLLPEFSQGWSLSQHSQWGWFNLRSPSEAAAWLPIYKNFPLQPSNAWISTCQSKGVSLTSSLVPNLSLLIPGSNSDQCVCLPPSVSISPFLSISISHPVPCFLISLCFFLSVYTHACAHTCTYMPQ